MKEKINDSDNDFEKSCNEKKYNKKHKKNKVFQEQDKVKPPRKKYKRQHINFFEIDESDENDN